MALVGGVVFVGIAIGSLLWLDYLAYRRTEHPKNYASQVEIKESRMLLTPGREGKVVTVIGMVENKSGVPIRRVQIEIQIYDKQQELVDSVKELVTTTIPPGEKASFKYSGYENIHLPEERYASHKLFVREARSE